MNFYRDLEWLNKQSNKLLVDLSRNCLFCEKTRSNAIKVLESRNYYDQHAKYLTRLNNLSIHANGV